MKISIIGNIGIGKTTVIRRLHEGTRLPVFLEPVDEWRDWLNLFYTDFTRWSFTFNLKVLMTFNRWKGIDCTALYERSPMCCKMVFTELQKQDGVMNPMEIELFEEIYENVCWEPDVLIYLRATPEVCMERMHKRGRACENGVSLEYLTKVHDQYEKMTEYARSRNIHVIVIDANRDADQVYQDSIDAIQKIRKSK